MAVLRSHTNPRREESLGAATRRQQAEALHKVMQQTMHDWCVYRICNATCQPVRIVLLTTQSTFTLFIAPQGAGIPASTCRRASTRRRARGEYSGQHLRARAEHADTGPLAKAHPPAGHHGSQAEPFSNSTAATGRSLLLWSSQ
eukprot:657109-Prymnesium_polylepis.2